MINTNGNLGTEEPRLSRFNKILPRFAVRPGKFVTYLEHDVQGMRTFLRRSPQRIREPQPMLLKAIVVSHSEIDSNPLQVVRILCAAEATPTCSKFFLFSVATWFGQLRGGLALPWSRELPCHENLHASPRFFATVSGLTLDKGHKAPYALCHNPPMSSYATQPTRQTTANAQGKLMS